MADMWTFSELPYARPDMQDVAERFRQALSRFENAADYAQARAAYLEQEDILSAVYTARTLASIRNTLDTTDPFYDGEMQFFHREMAQFMPLSKQAVDALLRTPFRASFEAEYGKQFFVRADLNARIQGEAIVADRVRESELENEYKKTVAACQVEFQGETCNFYGLLKHMESPDRSVRRAAFLAWASQYEGVSAKLDEIYDQLLALRVGMAEKLGLESYTQMAYFSKGRAEYTAREVAAFREQVRDVIVPAVARWRKAQAARIGVDKLRYYDESFLFPHGNADPIGGQEVLVEAAAQMYDALSPETGEFFRFMREHQLFDLTTRPGKHLGGYCTYLRGYNAPFIFSNFNGTAADVGVLTHETGHAFAGYTAARTQPIPALCHSTSEINEIHSMAMEHFAYPWMGKFFGEENAQRATFAHLCDAVCTIPYLVSVDAFQHRVYEKPDMSAQARYAVWKEIEETFLPWRDYDGMAFMEQGGFWMQKQHIFLYPFYYIDYALAQVCAFELYGRMKTDRRQAWADYLKLCQAGGSRGYFDLLSLANLGNPFRPGAVARAVGHVIEEVDAWHERL